MRASVVISNRNYARFLESAVRPYLREGSYDTEIVIVDDASEDESRELIARLAREETRIRPVYLEARRGVAAVFNEGFRRASHEIVLIQSADDVPEVGRLGRQTTVMSGANAPDVLGGGMKVIDESGAMTDGEDWYPISHEEIVAEMPVWDGVAHGTTAIRRSAFLDVGGHDESFPASIDTELWFRGLRAGWRFRNLDEIFLLRRIHGTSMGARKGELQQEYARRARSAFLGCAPDELPKAQGYWALSELDRFVPDRPLAVYGTGSAGRSAVAWALAFGREVGCFVESCPRGKEIDGIPVKTPEEARTAGYFTLIATRPGRMEAFRRLTSLGAAPLVDFFDATALVAIAPHRLAPAPENSGDDEASVELWQTLRSCLACPECRGELSGPVPLTCPNCHAIYHWSRGVPVLFPPRWKEARHEESWRHWRRVLWRFRRWELGRGSGEAEAIPTAAAVPESYAAVAAATRHKKLLDIGCGAGALAHARGVREGYLGIEPSPRRAAPDAPWVIGCAEYLPVPAGFFDAAAFMASLDYTASDELALREAGRALRSGGELYVLLNCKSVAEAARLSRETLLHYRHYTSENARELLERTGYTLVKERDYNGSTLFTAVTR